MCGSSIRKSLSVEVLLLFFPVCAVAQPPAPIPIFPCNIVFDLFTSAPITFTWSSSPGARAYRFQMLPLTDLINATNTISLSLPVTSGTYCWRVMAIDTAGRTSAWSSQCCFTVGYWSNIQTRLVTNKTTYSQGETVHLTFSVYNTGSDTIRLNFATTQHYDFTASTAGVQVWKWSRGLVFAQVLTGRQIAPRETVLYGVTWDQKSNSGSQVPPGSYVLQGILTNIPPPLVPPASSPITISAPTNVHDEELLPPEFILHQNYPNPFNPSTTIRYALPSRSYVKLEILNLLGQRVAELVNSEMEAGYHQIEWQPQSGVASGLYFYRLEAVPLGGERKTFSETKKLLFLR